MEEHAALSVLHSWGDMNEFLSGALPLVPEHVEIRLLQKHRHPGLPQVTEQQLRDSRNGIAVLPWLRWFYVWFCLSGLPPHVGGYVSY